MCPRCWAVITIIHLQNSSSCTTESHHRLPTHLCYPSSPPLLSVSGPTTLGALLSESHVWPVLSAWHTEGQGLLPSEAESHLDTRTDHVRSSVRPSADTWLFPYLGYCEWCAVDVSVQTPPRVCRCLLCFRLFQVQPRGDSPALRKRTMFARAAAWLWHPRPGQQCSKAPPYGCEVECPRDSDPGRFPNNQRCGHLFAGVLPICASSLEKRQFKSFGGWGRGLACLKPQIRSQRGRQTNSLFKSFEHFKQLVVWVLLSCLGGCFED